MDNRTDENPFSRKIFQAERSAGRRCFCYRGAMAREFAGNFYKTAAWISCRTAYAKSVGGLCERCQGKGIYKPGEIVHHKTWLNRENIHDPEITLNFKNLQLLCRDCHAEVHRKEQERRYKIAEDGTVQLL